MAGHGTKQNFPSKKRNPEEIAQRKQRAAEGFTQKDGPRNLVKPIYIKPRNEGQQILKEVFASERMAFASGPAGCGKTLLAVDRAIDLFLSGAVQKIIMARPAVSAEEDLGFLPGGIREKVGPYLVPLLDEMEYKLGGGPFARMQIEKWFTEGILEVVPLGFMRGRTFRNAAIVLDEMQNATYSQWKMALTRFGSGSYLMAVSDPSQNDLGERSGAEEVLQELNDAGFPVIYLEVQDVVRDPMVMQLLRALKK